MKPWRRGLLRCLPWVGLEWTPLGAGAGLVSRKGRTPQVDELSEDAWLVQRPRAGQRPLTVRPLGPRGHRSALMVDTEAARRGMRAHQRAVSAYLSDEHVAWLLRRLKINCVIDVGGNIGQFGKRLRTAGYQGRIVSFEPLPHTAQKLRRAADGDPEWHVVECALGDEESREEMTVVAGKGSTSSLLPVSDFGRSWSSRLEGVGTCTVDVRRLDQVFDEITDGLDEPRVYLKLDTQGYDVKAFNGAGDRIRDVVGMQSEISSLPIYEGMARLPEQIATYEAAGFAATGFFPVSRDRHTLRVVEFDLFMVRGNDAITPAHESAEEHGSSA